MSKLLIVTDEQFDYLKRLLDSEAAGDVGEVTHETFRHLDGDVDVCHDLQNQFAKVPREGDVWPAPDDLIDAAEELRHISGYLPEPEVGERASALLEQVAIIALPDDGLRDQLLEGRTDLGQPEVR